VGVNPDTPFVLDTVTHRCLLNCAENYTLQIDQNSATAVFDQRCEIDICKARNQLWGKLKGCTECWSKTDVDNYSTWKSNFSFDEQEMVGRNDNNPFSPSYTGPNSIIEVYYNEVAGTRSWRCTCQDGQAWIVTENQDQEPLCNGGTLGPELAQPSTLHVICPTEYHGSKMHV
jgi:hypothetical protein